MTTREVTIGQGTLTLETGKLAKQAGGGVIVRFGDSVVLVTACRATSPRNVDFLPLTVDYREYAYASGRIPGGFFKREGKPAEKEVLTSRMIDRPIRPLFPSGWKFETQIIALVLSADTANDTDVLAITGAGAALALSDVPSQKTVAAVRVGLVDGEYIINPTFEQRKRSAMDLIVAGSKDGLVMVEAGAKEVTEQQVVEALEAAHTAIKSLVAAIDDLAKQVGKKKAAVVVKTVDPAIEHEVEKKVLAPLTSAMRIHDKLENYEKVDQVLAELVASYDDAAQKADVKTVFKHLKEKVLYDEVLDRHVRLDGRKLDEIRPIWIETGVLPRVHGSAVFTRGETQALVTSTLGTADDAQKIETVRGRDLEALHAALQLPAVLGRRNRLHAGPGRREIGHGALAERALSPVIPGEETFPYTIRVVSDILESNGSSLDGLRLRRHARADGRRCADQGAGGRHRDGPGDGRRASTPSSPTSPAPKITTATWTSRSPAPRRASPRCRWTSRCRRDHRGDEGSAGAGRVGRLFILDKMTRRSPQPRAEHSPSTRRASSPSAFRWTRSAR